MTVLTSLLRWHNSSMLYVTYFAQNNASIIWKSLTLAPLPPITCHSSLQLLSLPSLLIPHSSSSLYYHYSSLTPAHLPTITTCPSLFPPPSPSLYPLPPTVLPSLPPFLSSSRDLISEGKNGEIACFFFVFLGGGNLMD